jgi:cephalosporin hydroxylase
MRTLREIFEDYSHYGSDAGHADKGSTHSYIEEYDKLFTPYRTGSTFMEIGLAMGMSLKMWCEYFEDSKIIGVDISVVFDKNTIAPYDNKLYIIEADATKPEFIEHIKNQRFDVVNDDGLHTEQAQMETFKLLKPLMNKGSIYVIEDILNLDASKERFIALHDNCEIFDLRNVKNRFDDCFILYRF